MNQITASEKVIGLRITLLVVAILMTAAAIGLSSLTRPMVGRDEGLATEFSVRRALDHVRAIAVKPHPPGSEEIERVRRYIMSELETLDIPYEIQDTAIAVPRGSSVVASSVKNIVARIPGRNTGSALLFDAHYDTRSMTPGASDCSSCIGAVLEIARILVNGSQMDNDVILLFTDNEEYGAGLGAAAFMRSHPFAADVKMVVNLEGLGSTGPSILFETGPKSRDLVRVWGRSAPAPVGQSWFQEIYRLTPIGTDLNWFSNEGVPGLNFGHWARSTVYHTELDNIDTLDPRSLQHTGGYALALAQHFGNEDLSELSEADAVYFTVLRGWLVSYPVSWALTLSLMVAGLLAAVVIIGRQRNLVRVGRMFKGLAAAFVGAAVSAVGATGIWMGIAQFHSQYQAMFTFRGSVYNGALYLAAFIALCSLVCIAVAVLLRRKSNLLDMTLGAALFWILLSIGTSIVLPGFSYLFTWPALFVTFAAGFLILKKTDSAATRSTIPLIIGAVPAVVLMVPAIYVMYHFAPSAMIGAVVFMTALLCGILLPLWNALAGRRPWIAITASAAVFVVFILIGSFTASFTTDRPRPTTVAYLQNDDDRSGAWFSAGTWPDEWSSQFIGNTPDRTSVGKLMPIESGADWFPILAGKAPYAGLRRPTIEVLTDTISGDRRIVRLLIRSDRLAPVITLEVYPYSAVRHVATAGSEIDPPESARSLWPLTYYAVSPEGFEVELTLDPKTPITLQVSDRTWELIPEVMEIAGQINGRDADTIPMPNFDYGTLVVKTFALD